MRRAVCHRERRPRPLVGRRILHGDRERLVGRCGRRVVVLVVAFIVTRGCLGRMLAN